MSETYLDGLIKFIKMLLKTAKESTNPVWEATAKRLMKTYNITLQEEKL